GAQAGNRNRAGHAHDGVATGPNVGGHSAPFFGVADWSFKPAARRSVIRARVGGASAWGRWMLPDEGADARRGAEQGGSGLPRRVSTLVSPFYVQKGRNRSVVPSLRPVRAGRKRLSAPVYDRVHVPGNSGPARAEPDARPAAPAALVPTAWSWSTAAAPSAAPAATSAAGWHRRGPRAPVPGCSAAASGAGRCAGPGRPDCAAAGCPSRGWAAS